MYPPGDKKTPTLLAGTSAFSFLDVLRRDARRIRILWLRESDMMLTESMNQDQAYQGTITARKPPRTKVAGVQEGRMTSGPPQASCALFMANLPARRASAIHINRRYPQATWPNAPTCIQVTVTCSLSELRPGILEILETRALPGHDRRTSWTKVRPIGARSRTTKRRRPAIHGFPGAGPHDLEGGQAHVLAVTGSAHSQAPPISYTDGADCQNRDTRTAR